jgi:hypothetical protein
MGHSIPVFLVPINENELPEKMEHWNDAENLLGEKYNNKEENKLYSITSRNWWIQHAISLICTDLGIIGIEFIMKEIVYIPKGELDNVEKALNKLIKVINNGIPELSSESEKTGTIYGLRNYFEKGKEYVFLKK